MGEKIALFVGFAVLSFSGRLLYRLYLKACSRFSRGEPDGAQAARPIALQLTVFSLASGFILLMMAYVAWAIALPLSVGSVALAGVLLLLIDNGLIFAGYQYSRLLNRRSLSDRLLVQKRETEASYFTALEEQYDRQRVLIHDIRKHLATIRDLAEGGGPVADYVRELEALPALQNRVRFCGNRTLDVVLSRYGEICRQKGVAFSADVRSKSVDFLEQSDITALFGNLLENAVEAAEGGEDPCLELLVDTRPGSSLLVSLVNTCQRPPERGRHGSFLSRKEGEGHGMGLRSVRAAVEKYQGSLQQYYEEGTGLFHTVVLLK